MSRTLSRWGRDYIAVSDYLEQIFALQIRFISVNDDYDSETLQYGSAGMVDVGFKNIMHDLYSKELSQKLRIAKQQLFAAGTNITAVLLSTDIRNLRQKNIS